MIQRLLFYFNFLILFFALSGYLIAYPKAPSFVAKTFGTHSLYSSQTALHKGPIVLSFWATWCGPCIQELRALKPYYETLTQKGVQFLAICIDHSTSNNRIKSIFQRYQLPFTVLLDPDQSIFKRFQGHYPPLTVLLDSQGYIVYKHNRYQKGDELTLIKKINQLLLSQHHSTLKSSLSRSILSKRLNSK